MAWVVRLYGFILYHPMDGPNPVRPLEDLHDFVIPLKVKWRWKGTHLDHIHVAITVARIGALISKGEGKKPNLGNGQTWCWKSYFYHLQKWHVNHDFKVTKWLPVPTWRPTSWLSHSHSDWRLDWGTEGARRIGILSLASHSHHSYTYIKESPVNPLIQLKTVGS